MAKTENESALTPPYGPWKTFRTFLAYLKKTAIPPVIDRGVMSWMSGSAQSEVRTALRFMGLINESGAVTDRLRHLVAVVDSDQWKQAVADLMAEAYGAMVKGVDLDTGTLPQLRERFKNVGNIEGSVLDKATRFYLSGLDDAGLTYSPHFKARGAASNGAARNKARAKAGGKPNGSGARDDSTAENEEEAAALPVPPGVRRFPMPLPGKADALIQVPQDLTEDEWKMLDFYIRSYFRFGKAR